MYSLRRDSFCLHPFWQLITARTAVLLILLLAGSCLSQPDATSPSPFCPKKCVCENLKMEETAGLGSQLLASCKDAGLLDIFTELDPVHTRALYLSRVKGFVKLGKSRMVDLQATRLLKLKIINSGIKVGDLIVINEYYVGFRIEMKRGAVESVKFICLRIQILVPIFFI
ncbi:hypothetical protein PoB_005155300 [Plakobranchus ocellatus]|uniref:Uncharacterized protein n=1 Tax=Plakobranchus ocellatus TaxID=259542 RepID=A0AAV4C243_9GAST|nr:hypothetical protein PoB_005155300 [Plakobranchus ocellatus]